jgi:uncharacterized protein (DUF433 family)
MENDMEIRYLSGESSESIAKDLSVNKQTVVNRLKKMGVEIRTSGGKITRTQVQQIAEEYKQGTSSTALAIKFGITVQTVFNCCHHYLVQSRTRGDYPTTRKHFFNENFFHFWSPNMAYVLGLITTDGNLSSGTLRIYQKEVDLLDKVQQTIGSSVPYDYCGSRDNPIPTLRLHSKVMVKDLNHLGIHPNKSLVVRAPSEIFHPQDYFRGVFDGDGYGGFYKKRKFRHLRIGISSGSYDFLLDLKRILPVPIGGPYKDKTSWCLHTTREENAEIIRDWMYYSPNVLCSDRKKIKLIKSHFNDTYLEL